MPLPGYVRSMIDEALTEISLDSEHHFTLTRRFALYKALGSPDPQPSILNPFRGWLGVLTAKYVLPIWHQALPIWEDIPPDLPDDNRLPDQLITTAEGVLSGTISLEVAQKEAGDQWYVVGNIGDEFSAYRDDKPVTVYFACDAALKALCEALNQEFLGKLRNWEKYTDDNLPDFVRDSASSAVVAYAGNNESGEVNIDKRQEFWEWWLSEAMPLAWERSGR
jgi:hypothetical protein